MGGRYTPVRHRHRANRTSEVPYLKEAHEPMTPPCECGYPLVKSDKRCPRCLKRRKR